jgi:hypothetical protein
MPMPGEARNKQTTNGGESIKKSGAEAPHSG